MKRILWIDIAKGIGILAVIVGHELRWPLVIRLVFPWHMPLFFMLAGFFVSDGDGFCAYALKKAKALLVPFFWTSLAVCVGWGVLALYVGDEFGKAFWNGCLAALYGAGSCRNMPFHDIRWIGAIWFLEALFWALIIVRVAGRRWWLIVMIAVISWLSANVVQLPLNIQSGGLASVFVYIGRRVYQETDLFIHTNRLVLVLGILFFAYVALFDYHLYLVTAMCTLSNLAASVFIVYLICWIAKMTANVGIVSRVLKFYGENSLLILCLHLFELQCVPWYALRRVPGWEIYSFRLWLIFLCKLAFVTIGVLLFRWLKADVAKNMRNVVQHLDKRVKWRSK